MTAPRVFVSYEATDAAFATRLIRDLQEAGAEVVTERVETSLTSTGRDETAFEQYLSEELPRCQQLVVVQTPEALQSPQILRIIDTALKYMQDGKMMGVLRVIAPTLNVVEGRDVPMMWPTTLEFDASQDYARALARLCLNLGLTDTNEVPNAPPPASYVPHLGQRDPQRVGSNLHSKRPSSMETDTETGTDGKIDTNTKLGMETNARPSAGASPRPYAARQDQDSLDRPVRPLRYPLQPLTRGIILFSVVMVIVLVIAGVTVFAHQSSISGRSNPITTKVLVAIHTPTPTQKQLHLTPTQQQSQPTPTAQPTQAQQQPTQPAQPVQPQQPPQPPQPTPTPTIVPCSSLSNELDCTGQDPIAQGCTKDAYIVTNTIIKDNNGNSIGQVDLRYSNTCQSNWSQVIVYNTCGDGNLDANVKRPDQTYQGKEYIAAQEPFTISNVGCTSNYALYTDMIYAPGTVTAQACGNIEGHGAACTILI